MAQKFAPFLKVYLIFAGERACEKSVVVCERGIEPHFPLHRMVQPGGFVIAGRMPHIEEGPESRYDHTLVAQQQILDMK